MCTIFFENLTLETHLYDYGKVGYFWVEGYEYLRQLEYRLAILRDKRDYLGEEYCNETERKLAKLHKNAHAKVGNRTVKIVQIENK